MPLATITDWVHRRLDEVSPRRVESAVAEAIDAGFAIDTPNNYCVRCGAGVDASAVTREGCPFCVGRRLSWHRLTRLGNYGPPIDGWIKAMKFGGQWRWSGWFGHELAQRVGRPMGGGRAVIVPVPLHWWRRSRRGFDQSRLMAEAMAQASGYPLVPALVRVRHARPQSRLTPTQRLRNVRRCFAARPIDLTGREVILVDDVKTTGATLRACATLLRRQGAQSIHAAVAAVADPRGQGFDTL